MAAILGVMVGVAQAPDADVDLSSEEADVAALDDSLGDESGDDWSEVSELVWGADWAEEEE